MNMEEDDRSYDTVERFEKIITFEAQNDPQVLQVKS